MRISGNDVITYVAAVHDLTPRDLKAVTRVKRIAHARQVAAYVMRQVCPHLSYSMAGRLLGGRDHTTILHGVRQVEVRMARDAELLFAVTDMIDHFRQDSAPSLFLRVRIIEAQRHLDALKALAMGDLPRAEEAFA